MNHYLHHQQRNLGVQRSENPEGRACCSDCFRNTSQDSIVGDNQTIPSPWPTELSNHRYQDLPEKLLLTQTPSCSKEMPYQKVDRQCW
jgi:hypothetical protein